MDSSECHIIIKRGHQRKSPYYENIHTSIQNDLEKKEQILKQIPRSNLSKKEKDALKTLSKREDTIITKADKGGAVVITDVAGYVKKANQQLDNTEFYKKLPNDTTELTRTKVDTSIEELKTLGLLDEKTANNLKSSEAKTPQFKTKKETVADQWSALLTVTLRKYQNI